MFANLGIAVFLSMIIQRGGRRLIWPSIGVVVLAVAVKGTASFSQVTILYGLLFLAAVFEAFRLGRLPWRATTLGVVVWATSLFPFQATSVGLVNAVLLSIVKSILPSYMYPFLFQFLDMPASETGDLSISLTQRIEMHQQAFSVITRDVPSFLFGDFATSGYHKLDGLHIQLLANGGIVWFLSFAIPSTYFALNGLRVRRPEDTTFPLLLAAMLATMLASRVLQYFPFDLLFFLIIAGVHHTTGDNSTEEACEPSVLRPWNSREDDNDRISRTVGGMEGRGTLRGR